METVICGQVSIATIIYGLCIHKMRNARQHVQALHMHGNRNGQAGIECQTIQNIFHIGIDTPEVQVCNE